MGTHQSLSGFLESQQDLDQFNLGGYGIPKGRQCDRKITSPKEPLDHRPGFSKGERPHPEPKLELLKRFIIFE